jgi:RNAse (barnase) inhibitor barstar
LRRARTLSEFHYNRVFIGATALASKARLHAELRFKLGLPSDYAANWDALITRQKYLA